MCLRLISVDLILLLSTQHSKLSTERALRASPQRHLGSRGLVQGDGVDRVAFSFISGLSLSASEAEEEHEAKKIASQNTKNHLMPPMVTLR